MLYMIFNIILSMSIIGTSVSILVFIMRFATMKLFSAAWNYYMVLLVMIFFLVPIGLFTENITTDLGKDYFLQSNFQLEISEDDSDFRRNIQIDERNQDTYAVEQQRKNDRSQSFSINRLQLFVPYVPYIWLLGVLSFIGHKTMGFLIFKRKLMKTSFSIDTGPIYEVLQEWRARMRTKQPIMLYSNDGINTPILTGLLKPYIIIPEVDMDDREVNNILRHELIHYKRKDLYLKVIVLFANALHWFNPLVYKIAQYMDELCELSCDEKAVKDMSTEERRSYGETILNLLDRVTNRKTGIYTSLCDTKKSVERRLLLIMKNKKYSRKVIALSIGMAIMFFATGTVIADRVTSSLEVVEAQSYNQQDTDDVIVDEFFAKLAGEQERFIEKEDIEMLTLPVTSGRVINPYGERVHPMTEEKRMHTGIDIAVEEGEGSDIVAAQNGKVIATQEELGGPASYGNYIILAHDDGTASLYAHCSRLIVEVGDSVVQGEKIAEVGSTGYVTGPHCHFEFRVNGKTVDPIPYIMEPIGVEDISVDEFFARLAENQQTFIEKEDIEMLMLPVTPGRIATPYGERIHPTTGEKRMHTGVDLAAEEGSDIVAAQNGKVIATQEEISGSYGRYIILAHDDGTASLYAHCSRLIVNAGDRVVQGEKIAEVGSTGFATGPHCHFEFRVNGKTVDPLLYIMEPTLI
ncbi:Murein DD-endopeptidase MepM and murein hydrolase activator NlpD, contain LysM domain [Anaerovirgula multivorans]|uniref:Murein DD-endopeptidase MepM and murein hydrolase activator NlpD, contain LysM domain n=1 Tax=Anaerovirgula multivorans TaxID=312168 RepID=A0A239K3L9_9FIRM|nr:peptidoglycan DD-metalloendopeptidase family protein [Anaerovirgula multivorans]SNT12358.1 Murein DD-endopeptidase MepM and murein hydrolase activator NlpD, contain LysM domain [Anaerovirgula multivorans]